MQSDPVTVTGIAWPGSETAPIDTSRVARAARGVTASLANASTVKPSDKAT